MNLSRYGASSLILFGIVLSACTQKPSFETPEIVIDRPAQAETSSVAATKSPASLLIKVPFAPQAPFAVWDDLHEEACEEMALIMVRHFLNDTRLSLQEAENELHTLIAWERANGYSNDVNTAELGTIAREFYGLRFRVRTNVTADTLRTELAAGNPVIFPAAGRMLRNPYFSGDGPWYHMLVITGYDKNGFITNDAGTKRGEKYWYSEDILMNALHDWTGVKEEIETGAKTVLVVER